MPIDKKEIVKSALKICVEIAKMTSNPIDDIIVCSAVKILDRVFDLEMDV